VVGGGWRAEAAERAGVGDEFSSMTHIVHKFVVWMDLRKGAWGGNRGSDRRRGVEGSYV
jgi:hypothetical protein